jgi:hypothetical protein
MESITLIAIGFILGWVTAAIVWDYQMKKEEKNDIN